LPEVNMKRTREEGASEGQNPIKLIKAVTSGDIAEARRLIAKMGSEEVNATDGDSRTALHLAAEWGYKEVCELLISKMNLGAINISTGYYGYTALHLAAEEGHKEVCELLISKMSLGAINASNENRNTALALVALGGHLNLCELLVPKMRPESMYTFKRLV
jgi:hypothetical protein